MTYDGVEYETVFDGTHHGADQDLLCATRIVEKLTAPSVLSHVQIDRPSRPGLDTEYALVCAELQERPRSRNELSHICHYTRQQVATALNRCRRNGILHAAKMDSLKRRGAPSVRYWVTRQSI